MGVVIVVIVVVVMLVAAGIGAGFGVERGLDVVDMAAEPFDHFLDDMVGAQADALAEQLDGQVAVAEVPGDAHEFALVVGVDLEKFLGAGDDADDAAIKQAQPVAMAQADGGREIEQNVFAPVSAQHDASAMAPVEV
jgi:hypothetical protein